MRPDEPRRAACRRLAGAASPPPSTPTATSTSRAHSPTSSGCRRRTRRRRIVRARRRSPASASPTRRDALQASKYGAEPAPHSWEIGQELESEQTFLRRGLGTDILTKLRRGHWSVQAELDLHGMITHEAHDALADFLFRARQQGLRCVRVIHGKGLTSPNREPVLKGKVRRWLAHWDDVLAYVEAPRHAGGGGAVLVLLRGT